MIQRPVYNRFERVIIENNRRVIDSALIYKNNRYCIDFNDFENKIKANSVKAFILCSPHNPVSRVWTQEELYQIGAICLRNNCLVISDEIHCDIVYEGHTHCIFSSIHTSFLENAIICTSPNKSFNISSLQCSNVFISNEQLRNCPTITFSFGRRIFVAVRGAKTAAT